jgi:hypothetical protein
MPDQRGPLADHIKEVYERASFVELFALLLSAYPDSEGVLTVEALNGFHHVTADLCTLAQAVNIRADAEP